MIRKVFCFRGIVYSESGCPLLDPAPFVPVREEDANCGRCVGFHRYAFNSSPCCIRSTIPSRAALRRTIISVFLQEAPDFQEGPSARITASPSPSGRNPHPLPNRAGALEPELLGRSPDIGIPDFTRQVAKRLR